MNINGAMESLRSETKAINVEIEEIGKQLGTIRAQRPAPAPANAAFGEVAVESPPDSPLGREIWECAGDIQKARTHIRTICESLDLGLDMPF